MRVDIDASYTLLAQRIADACRGASPVTHLGTSLAAVRDPAELNKKWVVRVAAQQYGQHC